METHNDTRTQNIALILIILAAISIAIGCKFEWRDLINFAMTFGGGGVGILTGQKLNGPPPKDPSSGPPSVVPPTSNIIGAGVANP